MKNSTNNPTTKIYTPDYFGVTIMVTKKYSNRYARYMYQALGNHTTDPNRDARWFTTSRMAYQVETLNIDAFIKESFVSSVTFKAIMEGRVA